jgi:UDP-N-acetylmuramyl pentapeptide synthase
MNKFSFFFKRPKVVVVAGNGRACAKEAIFQILKPHFRVGKEILLLDADKKCEFFLKRSNLPILVVTHVGEYHTDKELFAEEPAAVSEAEKLAAVLPKRGFLILNFDDETVRELKNHTPTHSLTFGFGTKADIRATDVVLTHLPDIGINFKINYQGNTVPIWLEKTFGKEQVYSALAAAVTGELLDLNLVEISEALKTYRSLPGKMRLISGMNNSWILDNSARASAFSTMEALDVLGKIYLERGRKIAVLGDILGIGKYTVGVYEAVSEKAYG